MAEGANETGEKPKVVILATGGTIAGVGDAGKTAGYQPGTLTAADKVRGRKRALAYIVDKMLEFAPDPAESPILILNADSHEDAERAKALVEQKLPGAKVMIENVGPVIGAHSGPGTIALCFIGTKAQA